MLQSGKVRPPNQRPRPRRRPLPRRLPEAQWFELVAAINDNDDELFQILKYTDLQSPYKPNKSGEFCPFANDLWFKYGNNIGFVDIVIHRV